MDLMENKKIKQQEPEELIHFQTVLLDQVRNAVMATDLDGRIVFWSKYAETIYQWQSAEVVGKELLELIVAEESRKKAISLFETVRGSEYGEEDWITKRKDGSTFPAHVVNAARKDSADHITGFIILSIDISEGQRKEQELLETKSLLEKILVSLGEAIALVDLDRRVVLRCNPAFEKILGYPAEEIIDKNTEKLHLNREKYEEFGRIVGESVKKYGIFCGQYKLKRKDNRVIFTEFTVTPLSQEKMGAHILVSVFRDITERKRAEREIKRSRKKLRSLTRHLQSIREEERSKIAREIHDELGHTLTALKLDISWLSRGLNKEQTPLIEKIKSMSNLIDDGIHTLQRMATELRPSVLDNLGLTSAIEWQIEDFHQRTGIKCELNFSIDEVELNNAMATTIFRVLQELLTNVARHANASMIQVSLKKEPDELILIIKDDGVGISTAQINDPKSFGLIGIRERIHAWHGRLKIKGSPEGTEVKVIVPMVVPQSLLDQ